MNVAVLGASDKQERYSYKAVKRLLEHGHRVFPIHPKLETIEGTPVYPRLEALPETVDTISVYLAPERSAGLGETLAQSGARRVIFNPGAENPALYPRLEAAGLQVQEACTLVLLSTDQF